MDAKSYLKQCIALARSVRIYNLAEAKQTLNYYQLHMPNWSGCGTIEDHPYVRHLRGQPAQSDPPAIIHDVDIELEFDIADGYQEHQKTKQSLIEDVDYLLRTAEAIGAFGIQRLLGSLYPYTGSLPLKNGTIIGYDTTLVEPAEISLIPDLQQWIYNTISRWTNSGYVASDELYGAAFTGILYAHMPSAIVAIRDKYVNTHMAHSFHVEKYLCDYGLEMAIPILNSSQKYSLYKHLPWIMQYRGHHAVYTYLKDLITQDSSVRVSEYHTRVGVSDENLLIIEDTNGTTRPVSTAEASQLANVSEQSVITALKYGKYVDTLPMIKLSVNGNTNRYGSTFKHMLYMWGWWAEAGIYVDALPFALPSGETRTLTTKTAFQYYLVHRTMNTYTDGFNNNVFYFPSILDTSGHTGQDLVDFVQFKTVTRSNFVEKVERIITDTLVLRSKIDLVTNMSERVYWEGEFPRHYEAKFITIPDKANWLAENHLPPLSDEYLDKLFDTFTGYTTSALYQRTDKAKRYKEILNHLLSMSTHVVTTPQARSECAFLQSTVATIL